MSLSPQEIIDDLNNGKDLLACGTLSQEEYDDVLFLLSERSDQLQATMESLLTDNAIEHGDIAKRSSDVYIGLEAMSEISDISDGVAQLKHSFEANPPKTPTQKKMAQLAFDAYSQRLGVHFGTVSQEGLTRTTKAIWDTLVKLVKQVLQRVKDFFKAIWRFITGKKRTLKETEKKADKMKADDTSAADFMKRQNEEIRKAKAEGGAAKNTAPEYDQASSTNTDSVSNSSGTFVSRYRDIRKQTRQVYQMMKKAARDSVDRAIHLGDDNAEYEEIEEFEIEVEVTRLGRKTLAFMDESTQRNIAASHWFTTDHLIALGDRLDKAVDSLTIAMHAIAGKSDSGLFKVVMDAIKNGENEIPNLIDLTLKTVSSNVVSREGQPSVVGPNGTFISYVRKDTGPAVRTSHIYSEDEFTSEFPAPNRVKEMTRQGLKLTDKKRDLEAIEKNAQMIQKMIDGFKDKTFSDFDEQKMQVFQNFTRIYITKMIIPNIQATAEAVAEYIALTDMLCYQAVELYNLDLSEA